MENKDLDWLIITVVVIIMCIVEILITVRYDPL